jgi:hypothetical protein
MKLKIAKKKHKELKSNVESKIEKANSKKAKNYTEHMQNSDKYRNMSHGAYEIFHIIPHARGEGWRQNHPQSLGKNHSKKKNHS